ncbi:hypothetical protein P7K49_001684, partial [Saguinus oedipus]
MNLNLPVRCQQPSLLPHALSFLSWTSKVVPIKDLNKKYRVMSSDCTARHSPSSAACPVSHTFSPLCCSPGKHCCHTISSSSLTTLKLLKGRDDLLLILVVLVLPQSQTQ